MSIRLQRLMDEIAHLASFTSTPAPSVTRVLYTPTDQAARAYLLGLCQEAGLEVRQDPLGNLFARLPGQEAGVVGTGSHTDAIPYAGAYDGVVGVLGGLEALRSLKERGLQPKRSIELLMFTSEEPTRFGLGCLGSRALSGALSPQQLQALHDPAGVSLDQARFEAGFSGDLSAVRLPEGYYSAFVELHIEQGPLLEQAQMPIGIVEAIAAPATLKLALSGNGGHAGALLMPYRQDSLLAAAEIALAVEQAAHSTGFIDSVATAGKIENHPNAVNSVPKNTALEIDVRDIDLARRDGMVQHIQTVAKTIAQRRGVDLQMQLLNADPPATSAPEVLLAIQTSCHELQIPFMPMVSRAYHDALFMARIAPTAMIFIPCREGVSHRPDEYASPEDIGLGVQVLTQTLWRLAQA